MLANEPTWTAERVELLKIHFAAGLSCREIADDIGVSRNAVIGKLSRLKRSAPRLQYRPLQAAASDEPIHNAHRCCLLDLSEDRCRWPISTPGAADFCFCGNPPIKGLPYCAGHTRLAYRPPLRQRVARG
jgi:GcrA cell cycle regulator